MFYGGLTLENSSNWKLWKLLTFSHPLLCLQEDLAIYETVWAINIDFKILHKVQMFKIWLSAQKGVKDWVFADLSVSNMLVDLTVKVIVCCLQSELKMLIMWVTKIGICTKFNNFAEGIIKIMEDWLNNKLYKVGVPKSWYIQEYNCVSYRTQLTFVFYKLCRYLNYNHRVYLLTFVVVKLPKRAK